MSNEQRVQNGRNTLINLNKTERHRKAVSENNKRLASEGNLSFQKYPHCAQTLEAKLKRARTCKNLYGGTGFKSEVIQQKCRESCLENNGYDNPFHSAEK